MVFFAQPLRVSQDYSRYEDCLVFRSRITVTRILECPRDKRMRFVRNLISSVVTYFEDDAAMYIPRPNRTPCLSKWSACRVGYLLICKYSSLLHRRKAALVVESRFKTRLDGSTKAAHRHPTQGGRLSRIAQSTHARLTAKPLDFLGFILVCHCARDVLPADMLVK